MDNKIAKAMVYIGILIIALGSLSFLLIGLDLSSLALTLGGIAASIILGVQFMALGEIVSLLQQSVDKQNDLLNLLNKDHKNTTSEK